MGALCGLPHGAVRSPISAPFFFFLFFILFIYHASQNPPVPDRDIPDILTDEQGGKGKYIKLICVCVGYAGHVKIYN